MLWSWNCKLLIFLSVTQIVVPLSCFMFIMFCLSLWIHIIVYTHITRSCVIVGLRIASKSLLYCAFPSILVHYLHWNIIIVSHITPNLSNNLIYKRRYLSKFFYSPRYEFYWSIVIMHMFVLRVLSYLI